MNEEQAKPQEAKPETTIQMSLNFKATYEWIGTDYVVHLTDRLNYFDLRIVFKFEYDENGRLVRRDAKGTAEMSVPLRAIASIDHSVIARKHFYNWVELTIIVESLPGWMRNMLDMEHIHEEINRVPKTA